MNKIEFYKETEFKETPIGTLPKDWNVVKLGDNRVASLVKSGSTPLKNRSDYWNGTIPFVTIGDMTKTEKYLYDTESKITESAIKNSSTFLVPENCILLSMYGTIGKVVINKVPAAISQNIAAIVLNRENTYEEFLHYALKHYSFQFKGAKIITLKHLDMWIVKSTKIPLPPVLEQMAIAEVLSVVDLAIQKTDEVIAKTERLKKGLMQELLTKGIGHKEFKDTEIGRIPKDWKVTKLGDITLLKNGERPELSEDGPFPVYGANGIMGYSQNYLVDNDFTLVIGRVGASGEIHLGQGRIWISDNAIYSESYHKSEIYPPYLLYLLKSKKLAQFASKTTHPIITQTFLKNLLIQLPELTEQQKIADILSTVDKKLEIERNEKARLERIKQGLMYLLLTGKIRVKVD
ncbi:restriction endonuclease subunit S [Thermofilum sp.]|uniref:restriction endonuclease subunit S n=1 Tax=Thermofilum sp. TaxID=1961369 RepID=UPI003166CEE3